MKRIQFQYHLENSNFLLPSANIKRMIRVGLRCTWIKLSIPSSRMNFTMIGMFRIQKALQKGTVDSNSQMIPTIQSSRVYATKGCNYSEEGTSYKKMNSHPLFRDYLQPLLSYSAKILKNQGPRSVERNVTKRSLASVPFLTPTTTASITESHRALNQ
ncbi:hypothetical protein L2E82_52361 [Cichorium intybus]|nr:hypothetical protein L2E82_52361 [Cichorium intybus]